MKPTLKEAAAAALEALTAADLLPERRAALQAALAQDAAEEERVRELLADVTFPGYRFRVVTVHGAALQVEYDEPDVESGVPAVQRGRKWYISSWATQGEVAQTALKAVLTSHEHRVREHFAWRGARVFGPHFDLDPLVRRAAAAHLVRAEVQLREHPALLQVRLALNHLPTAWVIACRAIEDAGGNSILRDAAATGDPTQLRAALVAGLAETPPRGAERARQLMAALEAVEREAGDAHAP